MGTTQLTQFAQGRSINRLICKNNDSVQTRGGRVCTWPNTLENLRQKRFLLLFHVHTLMKGYHFLHNLSLSFFPWLLLASTKNLESSQGPIRQGGLPSLNTQSCNEGLFGVRDFCFWAVWAATGPVLKKKIGD
jgi:hypothetical protein